MAIHIEELKKASVRNYGFGLENLNEALASNVKTAFLCGGTALRNLTL